MIFLVVLISVIFIMNLILPPPGSKIEAMTEPKKKQCPPHVWEYGSDGFLYCILCKNKPGYNPRD